MDGFVTLIALYLLCAVGVAACRRFASVGLDWAVVAVAVLSSSVAFSQGNVAISVWSTFAVIVASLGLVVRNSAAAGAAAIVAAAWLDDPSATALFWCIAVMTSFVPLIAAGAFLPVMALLGGDANQDNPWAFPAVVVLAIVLTLPSRPAHGAKSCLAPSALLGILIGQLRSQLAYDAVPDWILGAGVVPAVVMLLALGGGRGMNAVTFKDVLAAASSVVAALVVVAATMATVVPNVAAHWWIAMLAAVATLAAATALRPRLADSDVPETLDMLAGQAIERPAFMILLSGVLVSLLPVVPMANGWAWLAATSATLDATRIEPQPAFLLACLAVVGPITLAPTIARVVGSIWLAESRGSQLRFRPLAWCLAAVALAGPVVAMSVLH